MKIDPEEINLIVTNGYNGNTKIYYDFFEFSFPVQKEILSEVVLPLLNEYKSIHLSIGYKNT